MSQGNDEEDDSDDDTDSDDEEYNTVASPQKLQIGSAGKSAPHPLSAPPLQASVSGTKRPREEDEEDEEDVSGDYGEFEENSKVVNKKARAAAEGEV